MKLNNGTAGKSKFPANVKRAIDVGGHNFQKCHRNCESSRNLILPQTNFEENRKF